jgi:hypothetical protein
MAKTDVDGAGGYEVVEIYSRLRDQILSLQADTVASLLGDSPILAVLMETGYDKAASTLVTAVDGTVSFYFSSGGGMLGFGQHEEVRAVALEYLTFARQFLSLAKPTTVFPLPAKRHTTFYFVTKNGVLSVTAKADDLGNGRLPLSPLFRKAHEVITQARLVDERKQQALAAVMRAATNGDQKLGDLLKDLISPDAADSSGLTPLMAAAHSGQAGSVQVLLAAKATIDEKDGEGYTALMFACNGGKLPCVKLLVENGAKVNEGDNNDSTPIMFAAQHGHDDIVRYLLAHGADPNFVGKHGLSAVGFAHQNGLKETEKILKGKR